MEFVIDGKNMTDQSSAHGEIAKSMRFPDYYGRNLDALFDLLSTLDGKAVFLNTADALNSLGVYGLNLLKTFFDAAQANSRFTFILK